MRNFCKYLAVILTVAVLLCGGIVSHAEQMHHLQVKFITESGPVTNSTLKLYPALTTDGVLTEDFATLSVEVGDLKDSANVNRLAYTLASYAASGVGTPLDSDVTNGLGYVDFKNVPAGIYLVTGSSGKIGDLMYTPKPALISITDDSEEIVEVRLKYAVTASSTKIAYTVKKVWADQSGASHPQSVTVVLSRNGELYDEVTLSEENDWLHRWGGLSTDYDWNVIEKDVPPNYAVSITLDTNTFMIENKGTNSSGTTGTTSSSTSTSTAIGTDTTGTEVSGTKTTSTDTTGTETANSTETSAKSSHSSLNGTNPGNSTTRTTLIKTPTIGSVNLTKLPQTGQLWYPVPILFGVGALLFFVGFIADRLSEDDEKE